MHQSSWTPLKALQPMCTALLEPSAIRVGSGAHTTYGVRPPERQGWTLLPGPAMLPQDFPCWRCFSCCATSSPGGSHSPDSVGADAGGDILQSAAPCKVRTLFTQPVTRLFDWCISLLCYRLSCTRQPPALTCLQKPLRRCSAWRCFKTSATFMRPWFVNRCGNFGHSWRYGRPDVLRSSLLMSRRLC